MRRLVRRALKGALGTLDRGSGHPYASLATVATDSGGRPLLLLSRLALHTQNLMADDRASLLIDGTDAAGDPLAGGRVTLIGRVVETSDERQRARYLSRHPQAAMYAGFADFSFYRLDVERAHYVGGFGRIVDFSAADMTIGFEGAEPLIAAEAEIVAHMNVDHSDAVSLYATRLAGAPDGPWRMTGIDPEGIDLVASGVAARIEFPSRVISAAGARQSLVALAAAARAAGG